MLFTVSCTILLVPQASSFVQSVCLHVCTSRTTYKCARECVAGVGKEPAPPPPAAALLARISSRAQGW